MTDPHRGNSGDVDSIHGNTAVTELTVDADDRAVIKLLWNECRMSGPCALTLDIEA